jgi:hypothetical protein
MSDVAAAILELIRPNLKKRHFVAINESVKPEAEIGTDFRGTLPLRPRPFGSELEVLPKQLALAL